MRTNVPAIFCDAEDGECGAWTTDDYAATVDRVGDVKITRDEPSPRWRHDALSDEDFCPAHAAASTSTGATE